ncbi:alpha/beta fold hydrolase [Candidatus Neomarinimicrobiota bacterium]
MDITARFVEIEYSQRIINIWMRQTGKGDPIILIHGWGHSGDIWTQIGEKLSSNHSLIMFDLPGFGNSPPVSPDLISIAHYSDIIGLAMQNVLVKEVPFTIIGDSLGALIVLSLLANKAISSKRIILSGCPTEGLPIALRILRLRGLVSTALYSLQRLPNQVSHRLIRLLSRYTFKNTKHIDSSIINGALSVDPKTAEMLFRHLCQLKKIRNRIPVQKTGITTVIVRGEGDRVVSKESSIRLAKDVGATFFEIPDAGHTPMLENVDSYIKSITNIIT